MTSTSPTTPAPQVLRLSEASGRWLLLAAVLGSGIAFLDVTVVNVALPQLGQELGADVAGLQWTINGYAVTLAAFLLLGGSLGDRLGRRRIFLLGVVWFAVASLLCGLAPSVPTLVAARMLQGVGGALLTPGSLALIQASFAVEDRGRAIGAWSGLGGIAGAIGPLLGGWLVEVGSWRWVFLLNLPLAAVVVVVTLRHVPESRDPTVHGRFDLGGALLGALALGGIAYALIEAPGQGRSAAVLGSGLVGLLAALAFVVVERGAAAPMLPLSIFGSPQFRAANLVTFLVYGGLGGVFLFLVLQLQVVAGFRPTLAGSSLLPVTVIMLLLSARAGQLASRIGPRVPMGLGPVVAGLGLLLLTRIGPEAGYLADVLPGVVVFGLGLALTVAPLTTTVLAAADDRHAGVASAVNNTVARAAGLLAVAVLPLLIGLSGEGYRDPAAFDAAYERAMAICAGLMLAGGVLAWATIRNDVLVRRRDEEADRRSHCGVGAPPLQPPRGAYAQARSAGSRDG